MERKIFEKRINRFQELLKREDIDGAVIRTLSTFVYFTGTKWLRPALLIPQEGEPIVIVAKGEAEGDVIIDKEGAKHIIERHILEEKWRYKSKFKYLTADMLFQMLRETIETGNSYCPGSSSKYKKLALEKYYHGMGMKNKLRVVIQLKNGIYRIVTAFPVDR